MSDATSPDPTAERGAGVDDSDGVLDLDNLPDYWELLDRRFAVIEALPDVAKTPRLTARRFDEAQTAGHRTYFAATRYLGVAMDNHRALVGLMKHVGAGYVAPWSLLRPLFEAAFFACWILDPETGLDRRRRGLRCEVNDERERKNHLEAFKGVPQVSRAITDELAERDRTVGRTYRAEAKELGLPWSRAGERVNVVRELSTLRFVRTSNDPVMLAMLVSTWRMLSGIEHGLGYALLRASKATTEAVVPGGFVTRLTIDDTAFVTAWKSTAYLLLVAFERLERLHTRFVN
ncbi:hypothetical protein [Nocardioides bigeumensis]|uniref:Uncharacterized protein n=1 Tax=Nocardioides bigeumensis TaxID=433657 RepID=A0ABN2XMC8_9ACTN